MSSSPSANSQTTLGEEDKKLLVEAWKKTIEVQQHFNDLSWRIRALWLTALTFTLGATFLAYKDAKRINMGFLGDESPSLIIPILGLFLWVAFWFVDGVWYHRLLVGSVKEGARLEAALTEAGLHIELTGAIGKNSPINFLGKKLHSSDRLNIFYGLGGLPLVLTVVLLVWR
ncbi:hypothetical protein [Paenarthrobacter aromaticivorans]|uniref:hypothetical protein n=1 Tax=Paenarthrobacter aromaticivorans TaxID=2849150 RepID=UPI003A7FCD08